MPARTSISRPLISVEEYLRTSYRPDCDYVDGEVIERNLGEWDHSNLQAALVAYLRNRYLPQGIIAVTEQRVQVTKTRFRVPDVCVVLAKPNERILTKPPFLCIEILSPEDRLNKVTTRMQDYVQMGVRHAWILDPATKQAYTVTADGPHQEKSGMLATENPRIELPLADLFA